MTGDDDGAIVLGAQADVRLARTTEGMHGLHANANFTADGEVVARGRAVVASLEQHGASLEALDHQLSELDAVAVKSSSAGSQQLGSVTANDLALTGGLKLGARAESTPCGPNDDGTLMWNPSIQSIEVCDQSTWKSVTPKQPLGSEENSPGKTCLEIYQENAASRGQSGTYWLKPTAGHTTFQAFCEMVNHGGGWTLVLSAGMGRDLIPASTRGEFRPFPLAFPGQPAPNSLNKMSDDLINQIRTANDALGMSANHIGYWVTTPTSGTGALGAEIFHKHGCLYKMSQSSSDLKSGGWCHYGTVNYSPNAPSWIAGGHWYDNSAGPVKILQSTISD